VSYATDDAERSSACEILYACRGKIASNIRQEASRALPDARRLADLELVMSQLRDDRRCPGRRSSGDHAGPRDVRHAGPCVVRTNAGLTGCIIVRLLYGMLLKAAYAWGSHRSVASSLHHACRILEPRCTTCAGNAESLRQR
jgi:hypothetical protein